MILTDQQRETIVNEISQAIRNDEYINCSSIIREYEKVSGHSKLFYICWHEYHDQRAAYKGNCPFYVEDERGTFGFMRLRDTDGRILGYETKENKEYVDINYKPSPADKRKIAAIMESGNPLYYYIGYYTALSFGIVLTEFTKPAVYEYERKRHRRFDLTDPNPNNSALYMALYDSYFTQYDQFIDIAAINAGMDGKVRRYDFPTLTAETETRKNYYARLIQRVTNGEISIYQILHFPYGKGLAPKNGKANFRMGVSSVGGYNCDAYLNGEDYFASCEDEIDLSPIPQGLFWSATR